MRRLGAVAAGIALGLLAGMIGLLVTQPGPLALPRSLAAVITSPGLLENVVRLAAPIAVAGSGLALAYRAGFITIGSEGQMLLASLASLYVISYLGVGGPGPLLAALSVGALWGLIPGLLRAYAGVNEVLSSLMLNYIALSTVNYLVSTSLREGAFTQTRFIGEDKVLAAPLALGIAVLAAVGMESFLRYTMPGAAMQAYGTAPRMARTYLSTDRRIILQAALASGAASGLAGFLMLTGFQRGFTAMSVTPGYGYMGVLAAWLGLKSPIGALGAALLFSTLATAGFLLQPQGVPGSMALLVQALAVLGTVTLVSRGGRGWSS